MDVKSKMIFMSDELRNTSFNQKFKGYDPEQVEDFIDKVLECYDSLADEYMKLEKNFKELNARIGDVDATKQELVKLMSAAKLEADTVREGAKKQAAQIITAAKSEAAQLARDAQSVIDSQNRAFEQLKKESEQLRADIIRVCSEHIKKASVIDADAIIESLLNDSNSETECDETEDDVNFDIDKQLDDEKDDEKSESLFDTSFLRPTAGDGDPEAKIYTRQTHVGSFATESRNETPVRRKDNSTIADLAVSLKRESKDAASSFVSVKEEKHQSYEDMMQSLGIKNKKADGCDPLSFIK